MALRLGDACSHRSLADQQRIVGSVFMYKASKQYLAVSVSALVFSILFLLGAILVCTIRAPKMDGNLAADATILELKKSLP
jgi:hypothetical protein